MKKQIIALGLCLTLLACQYKMKDPLYDQLKLKNYIENCNHDIPEKLIPDDKFIFLEISIVESAKFIPRNPRISEIPCRNIDFPIYSYNDSLKEIKSWAKSFKPDFNRLKLVLGKEYWLTGIRGSGGGTDLYAFEYLTAYSGETAVYCIDSLGTIHLRHENIYYKVDYGQTIRDSSFYPEEVKGPFGGKLIVKKALRISNFGLIDKKRLIIDTFRH